MGSCDPHGAWRALFSRTRVSPVDSNHTQSQEALERLSYETGVPKHRMFMACPSNLADFHLYSGVRIITH